MMVKCKVIESVSYGIRRRGCPAIVLRRTVPFVYVLCDVHGKYTVADMYAAEDEAFRSFG